MGALSDLGRLLAGDDAPSVVELIGELKLAERILIPLLCMLESKRTPPVIELLVVLSSEKISVWDRKDRKENGDKEGANTMMPLLIEQRKLIQQQFESRKNNAAILRHLLFFLHTEDQREGERLFALGLRLIRNYLFFLDPRTVKAEVDFSMAAIRPYESMKIVRAMRDSQLLEFLIVCSSNCCPTTREGKLFAPHVVLLTEIWMLVLCWLDPLQLLAPSTSQMTEPEQGMRRPIRHGRFGGSVVLKLENGKDLMLANRMSLYQDKMQEGEGLELMDRGRRKRPTRRTVITDRRMRSDPFLRFGQEERNIFFEIGKEFVENAGPMVHQWCSKADRAYGPSAIPFLKLITWMLRFARLNELRTEIGEWTLFLMQYIRLAESKQWPMLVCTIRYHLELLRYKEKKNLSLEGLFSYQAVFSGPRFVLSHHFRKLPFGVLRELLELVHVQCKLLKLYCSSLPGGLANGIVHQTKPPRLEEQDGAPIRNSYQGLLREYAHEGVVDALVLLLQEGGGDETVSRHVGAMLIRLHLICPELLMRATLIEVLYSVLLKGGNPSLVAVAERIGRSFLENLERDPLTMIAAFYPASSGHKMEAGEAEDKENDEDYEKQDDGLDCLNENEKMRWMVRELLDREYSQALRWLSLNMASKQLIATSAHVKGALLDPLFGQLLRLLGFSKADGLWTQDSIDNDRCEDFRRALSDALVDEEDEKEENGDFIPSSIAQHEFRSFQTLQQEVEQESEEEDEGLKADKKRFSALAIEERASQTDDELEEEIEGKGQEKPVKRISALAIESEEE